MTLLAILGIAIYEATTRSYTINYQLTHESDDYIAISSALAVIDEDISQIFNPIIGSEAPPQESNASIPLFWSLPVRPDGTRRSRFKGSVEKISFITNSNHRFEKDLTQSDFLKITWEIEKNKSNTYTLYRTTDWDAFNYEDSKQRKLQKSPVISNLTSGKFMFFKALDKTWTDTWDSEGAFINKQARFPDMISLKMELPDPTNNTKSRSWQTYFKPNENPNTDGQIGPVQTKPMDLDAIPNPT